jgi:hypothetical protein
MQCFEYWSDANFHHVRKVFETLMRLRAADVRGHRRALEGPALACCGTQVAVGGWVVGRGRATAR